MRRRAAPPMHANKGGGGRHGEATGKKRARTGIKRIFSPNFKRSIIRRYKHSFLY